MIELIYMAILFLACVSPIAVWALIDKRKELKATKFNLTLSKQETYSRGEEIQRLEEVIAHQRDELKDIEKERDELNIGIVPTYTTTSAIEKDENGLEYFDISNKIKVPFAEPIKQCECGNDMRETKCYYICDVCKKRVRKVVE